MFFFVITKNLNWEILTKNLVAFQKMGWVKDEKFQYYGGHWKIQFSGGVMKNQYIRGDCFKRGGAWAVYRFKGVGACQRRGDGVFESGGGLVPQCTLCKLWIHP